MTRSSAAFASLAALVLATGAAQAQAPLDGSGRMPGGGYVAIELTGPTAARVARVVVERRGDRARRVGHRPPVIHEEQWRPDRGFGELYRMACDNVVIARGLMRLRAD